MDFRNFNYVALNDDKITRRRREIECAREGILRGEQPKAVGTINARYTSGSKERRTRGRKTGQTFGADQKPIKFRRDPRAVDSSVHEIAIRLHADFDTLPSRRSAPRSRSALSSLSHPATPSGSLLSDATMSAVTAKR